MLSGLTRILSKIKRYFEDLKWWVNKSETLREQCHGFCPNCPYDELCMADEAGLIDEDDFDWYADADYDYPWE